MEQRRYKHRMITFFKMVKNLTPPYLQDLVPPNLHQISNRNLRNQTDFTIPRSRTNLYDSSFIPTATREWNSLPAEIKSSTSISIFKRMLNRDKIKVPSFFFNGDRKAQVLHARLRLACSSLNADLFNNHILMTNKCSCGSIETAEHFLLWLKWFRVAENLQKECFCYFIISFYTVANIHHFVMKQSIP